MYEQIYNLWQLLGSLVLGGVIGFSIQGLIKAYNTDVTKEDKTR